MLLRQLKCWTNNLDHYEHSFHQMELLDEDSPVNTEES